MPGNERVYRRYLEIFTSRDLSAPPEVVDVERYQEECAGVTPGPTASRTRGGTSGPSAPQCRTLPDMALHYNEVFGAGEQIVARGRATGTNKGTLFGMPAAKEAVEFQVLYIARVENGKIVERWLLPDLFLTKMRRAGLTPTL